MSTFQSEEKKRTRTYDLKIIKWLLSYVKPHRPLFILSLLLMILTAALEVSIPYLTKYAVDNYIYPTWVRSDGSIKNTDQLINKYPEQVIRLEDGSYLVNISRIDRVDSTNLEKSGSITDARYMVFNISGIDNRERTQFLDIFNRNENVFYKAERTIYYAKLNDLELLERNEIQFLRSNNYKFLVKYFVFISLGLLGVFIFTSAFTYSLFYSGHKIMHSIRHNAFSYILRLPQSFFDKNPVGRITTRVTNDVNAINEMYTSVLVQFIKDILVIIGIISIMFTMNAKLTLIILCLTLFLVFAAALFRMRLKTAFRNIRITIGKLNSFVQESIQGITLIKLYNKEYENFKRFNSINRENYSANMSQLWTYAMFRPFIEYVSILGVGLILWQGGRGVINHDLTIGGLIAFLYYVRMLFNPIQQLSERYNIFQSAVAASENLYDLIHEPIEKSGNKKPSYSSTIIEFRKVWFSYNDRDWTLKDVSFKICPGDTVALVGLTGSGKTTVVNLILKFYKVQRGEILFNGVNINDVDNNFLRASITAIFQDLFLFGKDILDEPLDYEKIKSLLGEDRKISTQKSTLSSGEIQVVSFIKALNKKSTLLIMDEATSNIDAKIEKNIQKSIRSQDEKARLIIAHRLSNVRHADRIIVIHKGSIVETGTHHELLENRGIYYNLNNYQKEVWKVSSATDG